MKLAMNVKLVKEPDNAYGTEAIKVMIKGIENAGYYASSLNKVTVTGESWSAGSTMSISAKRRRGKSRSFFQMECYANSANN